MVIKVKYISLVNLIMGSEVVKELVSMILTEELSAYRTGSHSAGGLNTKSYCLIMKCLKLSLDLPELQAGLPGRWWRS